MADGDLTTTPTPDPTILTQEAVDRAIDAFTDTMDAKLKGLTDLMAERFNSFARELALIERQRVEGKADTEKAVQAALSAAKEAVQEQTTAFALATAKSEGAATRSIEQLGTTFTTALDGFRRDIDGLKERITSVESQRIGEDPTQLRRAVAELSEKMSKLA